MAEGNHSEVTEFILSGLTDRPQLQMPLFLLFLLIYIVTIVGNGGMVFLIKTDPRLNTPMYFFLSYLSFCDLCYSTVICPKMLHDILAKRKTISRPACAVQFYLCYLSQDVECLLLAVMAYDRYAAICNPLLYTVTMSTRLCNLLLATVYGVALADAATGTYYAFRLSFCRSKVIDHFFCDYSPLMALSCSDTHITKIVMFASMCYTVVISVVTILLSYVCIISTILRIRSAKGIRKAFSTCASHLTSVGMFHGTLLFMSFRPTSSYSTDTNKITSVFYTLVVPMLNPLVYSLRNTEVKGALRKAVNQFLHNS